MSESKSPNLRRHFPSATFVVVTVAVIVGATAMVVGAGLYDIGADAPHTRPIRWLLDQVRERSIAVRARRIEPPADFARPQRLAVGAGLYAEMCAGCHLAPGMERTELSQGLYPPAPELAHGIAKTPGEEFWIIKHGVKLTAMPAWGRTHSDTLIWDMVAFVRALPNLSPAQYRAAVANAPSHDETMMKAIPGMDMNGEKPPPRD